MNYKEAKETLLKMAFAESTEFAEDRLFAFGYSDEHEALMIAIEALEKQIPKKPIEDTEYVGWLIWRCPICRKEVGRVLEPLQHHCECGQAIDWEV